ncbi:MAG: LPXTG cell wall anchor domain-containing protein [Lachnospiraceae bacterium]|nr:LPXTG cell wall anchor domain-containing protein [Lachnospiraceae bacterium]
MRRKMNTAIKMKKTAKMKTTVAAVAAATVLVAAPAAGSQYGVMTVSAATTSTLPSDMKEVTEKGTLTISIPEAVSDNYKVKAYELLQLVIPKDTTWTAGTAMTNTDYSKNVYVVTDSFKAFFAAAKTSYTAGGSALPSSDTLYLTYDVTNRCLQLTDDAATVAGKTVNEDYIVIDNTAYSEGHKGRLDTKYFEADLVSRITDSDPINSETNASEARLLSDWASRYIKAKQVAEDNTAVKKEVSGKTVFQFSSENSNALVYGYYVLVTSDKSENSEGYVVNQSILNVPQAENVTLKATPITIDKSVTNLVDANKNNNDDPVKKNEETTKLDIDEAGGTKYDKITANIGDVLQYRIESHIPSLTSYDLDTAETSGKLLGLTDSDAIAESDFGSKIAGKYVYTFRDTMINQDFIPEDTTVAGASVTGLKMEVYQADGTTVDKTYVVKNLGDAGSPKYYLVEESIKDTAAAADAIGRIWETDYAKSGEIYKNFFAVNFDLKKLKTAGYDGKKVIFIYNAELKGEAGNADAVNTAKITYSNDPYDPSTTDTVTDDNKVYTYDVRIDKVFSDGAAAADLYGKVKFVLYTDSAKTHAVNFVKKADGSYVRADGDDASDKKVTELAVETAGGTLQLHGLGEGTYYLAEQSNEGLKNAGYNIVNTITVVVTAKDGEGNITDSDKFDLFKQEGTPAANVTKSTAMLDGVSLNPTVLGNTNEYGIEFSVVNQKGFRLPLTGEYGNRALAVAGIVLVAVGGTVIVLVNRKKKDVTGDNEA